MTELLFAWPALLRVFTYIFPQQKKRKVKEGGGGMLIYKLREGGGGGKKNECTVSLLYPQTTLKLCHLLLPYLAVRQQQRQQLIYRFS